MPYTSCCCGGLLREMQCQRLYRARLGPKYVFPSYHVCGNRCGIRIYGRENLQKLERGKGSVKCSVGTHWELLLNRQDIQLEHLSIGVV
jgi:hypothetical protein